MNSEVGINAQHLVSCIRATLISLDARDEYDESNPNACEVCEGWGYVVPVPTELILLANSLAELDALKVYCSCILNDTCPRCGLNGCLEDGFCLECDFELGKTQGKDSLHLCTCKSG